MHKCTQHAKTLGLHRHWCPSPLYFLGSCPLDHRDRHPCTEATGWLLWPKQQFQNNQKTSSNAPPPSHMWPSVCTSFQQRDRTTKNNRIVIYFAHDCGGHVDVLIFCRRSLKAILRQTTEPTPSDACVHRHQQTSHDNNSKPKTLSNAFEQGVAIFFSNLSSKFQRPPNVQRVSQKCRPLLFLRKSGAIFVIFHY